MKYMIATKRGFVDQSDTQHGEHVKCFTANVMHALTFTDVTSAQDHANKKYSSFGAIVVGDMTQQEYTLYWLDGTTQTLKGTGPNDALRQHGYGGGAMAALDFYAEGKLSGDYEWSADKKTWVRTNRITND